MIGLIPAILGLIVGMWGWVNLRAGRKLPLSGIAFLAGCTLWGLGLLVILPWSVTR